MRKLLQYLLLAGLALSAATAAAATKIGYVDVERVLKESPQTAESSKVLEKEFGPRTNELIKLQKQISDEEKSATPKEQELSTQKLEFERKQRELNEDINIRKNEELAVLQDRINKAVTKVSETGDYDLVIYSGLAYVNKRVDLTDEVLKLLGKSTP